MTTENTNPEAEPSAVQQELTALFRSLCVGRPNAAFRLAEMLAPLLEQSGEDAALKADFDKAIPVKTKAKAK